MAQNSQDEPPKNKLATVSKLTTVIHSFKNLKFYIVFVPITLCLTYLVLLLLPRNINFSYSNNSCISQPIILPNLYKSSSQNYTYSTEGSLKFKNLNLFSSRICVMPQTTPSENSKYTLNLKLFGYLPAKKLTILTDKYPTVNYVKLNSPLSPIRPTNLELSKPDKIFAYKIHIGNQATDCQINSQSLSCPIEQLNLKPGSTNPALLNRTFNNQLVSTLYEGNIKTLDPIAVTGGNAIQDNTIFDKPEELELIFNKPLASVTNLKLLIKNEDIYNEVAHTYDISDAKLKIKPNIALARKTTYKVSIDQATSTTDNVLPEAYTAEFYVSGGPKVVSSNTGTYKFTPNKNISINFDQEINSKQDLKKLITISGLESDYVLTISGKSITLNPNSDLPYCSNITIKINNQIQNKYEISGDSTWQHNFRAVCGRSSIIGTRVQGRPITAHWYGKGPSMVLFVGGIHGNEKSSTSTLESWLDELEKNADRIPSNRTIVVITSANPDGFSANSRFNASGVDLNRNFPSLNWSSTVSGPGYSNLVNGGGTAPLSEPETTTLVNFVNQYRPRAVFSFHATANLVSPNYAGDSEALAQLYASKTPYRFANGSETDQALGYSTSGDFEFWLRDIGIPNVIIEQSTLTKDEINKNRDALWVMVSL